MLTKKIASNLILFLFFILVGAAALLSDLFQNPLKTGTQVIEQTKLFTNADLDQIKRLSLKNKSGEYIFERNENNLVSPWHMISPRDISANSLFIDKLFSSLAIIKVKKIFPDDKMNFSNFSLDRPSATLSLIYQNGKSTAITVGLMNSIDNSTYLKIQNRTGIYHVEAPAVGLDNATISDLIKSQIISLTPNTVATFQIFQGNKKTSPPLFEIKKKNSIWVDHQDNALDETKVDDFFQELSTLKSSFIIDKQTEAQKKQMAHFSTNPALTLSVEDNKGEVTDYKISEFTHDINDIDLKNEEHFLISVSSNVTIYVVKKEFYEIFNKKIETLRPTRSPQTN